MHKDSFMYSFALQNELLQCEKSILYQNNMIEKTHFTHRVVQMIFVIIDFMCNLNYITIPFSEFSLSVSVVHSLSCFFAKFSACAMLVIADFFDDI